MAVLSDYLWICIVGGGALFMTGFGIGANDCGSNFGSAVGSRSISLGKAIILAAICEFIGSVAMGASVTNAIRGDIIDMNAFVNQPDILMYGNLCSLVGAGAWLLIASWFGMPVSTTHSIVGALIGFGVATGKSGAVKWKGVSNIIISWFASPILALLIAMLMFGFLRWAMLRRSNPVKMGYKILWLIIFVVCVVFAVFLTFSNPVTWDAACLQSTPHGAQMKSPCSLSNFAKTNILWGLLIALGFSLVLSALMVPVAYWYTRRHLRKVSAMSRKHPQLNTINDISICSLEDEATFDGVRGVEKTSFDERQLSQKSMGKRSPSTTTTEIPDPDELNRSMFIACGGRMKETWQSMPWNQDIHGGDDDDGETTRMHDSVESFDPSAEAFFSACQVLAACCLSLAHGANDVANGTGPYAAIIALYLYGSAAGNVDVPLWILVVGGASIAVGLAVLGHKVIKTIGVKMIKVTPSRGVVSDIATTLTVVIFSNLGVPLSSTHCKVGSNLGVGLLDKSTNPDAKSYWGLNPSAVNWKLFGKIVFCWVATLAFAGSVSASLFAFGAYGPTLQPNYYDFKGPGALIDSIPAA